MDLTPRFSANRAVRQYTEDYYLPGAKAYNQRTLDRSALGVSLLKWKRILTQHWTALGFGDLHIETSPQSHSLKVEVHLGELPPEVVRVELYADSLDSGPPFVSKMTERDELGPSKSWRVYTADVSASRPASDYTPRIVPSHTGARIPLEDSHILWFR